MYFNKLIFILATTCMTLVTMSAEAMPAFARKTNLACSTCHTAWPSLNAFGRQYKEHGYRLGHLEKPGKTISKDLKWDESLPISVVLVARPYDKKDSAKDAKNRALHEVELMVADVSGKGMGAALLTASLEALVAGPLEVGYPPDEICRRLSRRLLARTPPEKFATVFLVRLQSKSGWLTYCSAGHNPALVLRTSGAIDLLEPTGIPVGLFAEATYGTDTCALELGETLVIYTDGIVEAENTDEEEYGLDRLLEACQGRVNEDPDQLAGALETHLLEFTSGVPFADDRTLLILRRKA